MEKRIAGIATDDEEGGEEEQGPEGDEELGGEDGAGQLGGGAIKHMDRHTEL